MILVTLEQAKAHLRSDTSDGDADLLLKVKAASRAVMNYISGGRRTLAFTDSAGAVFEDSSGLALDIPEDVQDATLFVLGAMDANRNSDSDKTWGDGLYLPAPAKALLIPYRDPSLA